MFVDTHCHLDDERFNDFAELYNLIENEQVDFAINMGCDLASSIRGKEFAENYSKIYFGAGFHPNEVEKFNYNDLDLIKKLTSHEKCVAVGEIGLDFHYEGFDKELQQKVFVSQLELAKETKLPISIHCRDATESTVNLLKTNKNLLEYGGVMHCYSGSIETAKILLDLGLYISFAGTLTFKNAKNLVEVASFLPIDRILTETDSPYLSPEPFRGKVNNPSMVKFVAKRLAEIKNLSLDFLCEQIRCNAKKLFYKIK